MVILWVSIGQMLCVNGVITLSTLEGDWLNTRGYSIRVLDGKANFMTSSGRPSRIIGILKKEAGIITMTYMMGDVHKGTVTLVQDKSNHDTSVWHNDAIHKEFPVYTYIDIMHRNNKSGGIVYSCVEKMELLPRKIKVFTRTIPPGTQGKVLRPFGNAILVNFGEGLGLWPMKQNEIESVEQRCERLKDWNKYLEAKMATLKQSHDQLKTEAEKYRDLEKENGELNTLLSASGLDLVLNDITCPITHEIFNDPVIAADGHTYERNAIFEWFKTHDSSPKTGAKLSHRDLTPNHTLKCVIRGIQALLEKQETKRSNSTGKDSVVG